ncbi:MAG: GxxExxY protein [Planctomycetota bacterium]
MLYDRVAVGEYFVDLLVAAVIVELKVVNEISDPFAAHCLNYLEGNRPADLPPAELWQATS